MNTLTSITLILIVNIFIEFYLLSESKILLTHAKNVMFKSVDTLLWLNLLQI